MLRPEVETVITNRPALALAAAEALRSRWGALIQS